MSIIAKLTDAGFLNVRVIDDGATIVADTPSANSRGLATYGICIEDLTDDEVIDAFKAFRTLAKHEDRRQAKWKEPRSPSFDELKK